MVRFNCHLLVIAAFIATLVLVGCENKHIKNYYLSNTTVSGTEDLPVTLNLNNALRISSTSWQITIPPTNGSASISNGVLTFTPAAGWVGVEFVVVADVSTGARYVIEIAIEPRDDAPTITGLVTTAHANNTYPAHLPFDLGDVDTPLSQLTIGLTSDNTANIPTSCLAVSGSGTHRELVVTPPSGITSGTATVTLSVADATTTTTAPVVITIGDPLSTSMLLTAGTRGGPDEAGAVFGYDISAAGAHTLETFPGVPFGDWGAGDRIAKFGSFVATSDLGPFYGLATRGGSLNKGAIVLVDPDTLDVDTLWSFYDGGVGYTPTGDPVIVGSKLYGWTYDGDSIFAYDLVQDTIELIKTFSTTPGATLGNQYSAGLALCSTGRIFGVTLRDGTTVGKGALFSFDPGNPSASYDFVEHYRFPGQVISSPEDLAFEKNRPYGYFATTELLHMIDASLTAAKTWDFCVARSNTIGGAPFSVTCSGDTFLTYFTLKDYIYGPGDGTLVRVSTPSSTGVTVQALLDSSSDTGNPLDIVSLSQGRCVGLSENDGLNYSLWALDEPAGVPRVVKSFPDYIRPGRAGAAGDHALAWTDRYMATSEDPFLIAYDMLRGDLRELPVGYPRGISPRGGLVEHANGRLYGVSREALPSPGNLLYGFSEDHAIVFSWNPMNGKLEHARLVTGASAEPVYSDVRPAYHAGSGALYVIAEASTGDAVVLSVDPDTLAATEVARHSSAGADARQGGTFVGDILYYFAGKGIYELDVGATTPTPSLLTTALYEPIGRPTVVGNTFYGVLPTGYLGNGAVFKYDTVTPAYSLCYVFQGSGTDGCDTPETTLLYASDGKLYGLAQTSTGGTIFSIDPANSDAFATVDSVPDTNGSGAKCRGELLQRANGDLWGLATEIGADSDDETFLFKYDLLGGSPSVTTYAVDRDCGFANPFPELVEVDVADQLRH